MEVYVSECIKILENMSMLKDFRKLGKIFYHKYWDSNDSRSVSRESLIWLWEKLVLILCFNHDLPSSIRFIERTQFIEDMRKFLSFCYELKQGLKFKVDEKWYPSFFLELNVFYLSFNRVRL